MTDSCQHKSVIWVQKTSLHERCIKTVTEFSLILIVYAVRFLKLNCVRLCSSVVLIKNDDDDDDDDDDVYLSQPS